MNIPSNALVETLSEDERCVDMSLCVHEWMHHFRPYEDVSMFAEMIYLLEHNKIERLEEIQAFYNGRHQPGNPFDDAYIQGLEQIAAVLGVPAEQLTLSLSKIPLEEIKDRFRAYTEIILRKKDPSKIST